MTFGDLRAVVAAGGSDTTPGDPATLTLPSDPTPGDLLALVLFDRVGWPSDAAVVVTPGSAGAFSSVRRSSGTTTTTYSWLWWKRATAAADRSVTVDRVAGTPGSSVRYVYAAFEVPDATRDGPAAVEANRNVVGQPIYLPDYTPAAVRPTLLVATVSHQPSLPNPGPQVIPGYSLVNDSGFDASGNRQRFMVYRRVVTNGSVSGQSSGASWNPGETQLMTTMQAGFVAGFVPPFVGEPGGAVW